METPLPGAAATTPLNPNQARSSITSILLISIVLFLLSGDDPSVQAQQGSRIHTHRSRTSTLSGNYTAWLNGTASNFTLEDTTNITSPIVDALLPARLPIDDLKQSYFTNTTGFVNGMATFFNLSDPSFNHTWNWNKTVGPLISGLNQTRLNASLGDFHWAGIDKIAGNVRELRINQSTPYSFLAVSSLNKAHLSNINTAIGQLIPLVPASLQNMTAYAIKDEIDRQIHVLQDKIKNSGGGQAEDKNSVTTCSFQLYSQIKAADFPVYLMQELESEMEDPTGARTVSRPPLKLDGLILSPDCAVALTFKDAVDSFIASICYFVILKLIVRQMETSRTPSSIAKISRWTFALQAIADAYSFVGVSIGDSEYHTPIRLTLPRFSMLIHQIQGPEDAVMRAPITPTPNAVPTTNEAETPLLADQPEATPTLPQASTPPGWMVRVRRIADGARSFVDRIMILFAFLFLVQITVSPRLVLYAIGALYSFWVPQIMRNVKRGTRKALQKRYVIGTTLCPWIWLVAGWALLQCAILVGQEYLGPSFFLPKGLVEIELYDWHPPIARPDAEAPNRSLGDCAICMDDILLDSADVSGGAKEGASLLAGVGMGPKCVYAIAPCHHMFVSKKNNNLSTSGRFHHSVDSIRNAWSSGLRSRYVPSYELVDIRVLRWHGH
ncbi:hypothetical protein AG1IA_05266 [Rhizoctonia solani AG-1 IA]|uniref:RING-type E3 ubiquitin transferase n=1 Tax=Thanatephorus cucumeris (strain AG1-IA) TaxID=983506 RepID=L8WVA3_THACA|nr:hypothetical protein AG1IA_05266 [Rhizoctonia solani AG-1 IA]